MKKLAWLVLALFFLALSAGCADGKSPGGKQSSSGQSSEAEEQAVRELVEGFGGQLKNVSLLAPKETVAADMQKYYGEYVAPALLEKWKNDPSSAPGRLTSSPWPDRIEIRSVERLAGDSYEVSGDIVEVTSAEESGGAADTRPIRLSVQKIGDRWLIVDAVLGEEETADTIVYQNAQYGLTVTLPASWKGYTILTEEWQGFSLVPGKEEGKVTETGPQISIRHPLWTEKVPRQDLPILVFTLAQWEEIQKEKFHIGAAPMNPSELARNSRYVFALPARYNFSFPEGYEEVDALVQGGAVGATEEFGKG